jgi:hypothetical protein
MKEEQGEEKEDKNKLKCKKQSGAQVEVWAPLVEAIEAQLTWN